MVAYVFILYGKTATEIPNRRSLERRDSSKELDRIKSILLILRQTIKYDAADSQEIFDLHQKDMINEEPRFSYYGIDRTIFIGKNMKYVIASCVQVFAAGGCLRFPWSGGIYLDGHEINAWNAFLCFCG